MTACRIIPLPDRILDLAAAREVIRSPFATREQLRMAADVLSMSPDWCDLRQAQDIRSVLFAQPGAELSPAAQEVQDQIDIATIQLFVWWVVRGCALVAVYIGAIIWLAAQ